MSPQLLPGEPSDTLQGGFQPVTASLCQAKTRYFPVLCVCTILFYTTKYIEMQEENEYNTRCVPHNLFFPLFDCEKTKSGKICLDRNASACYNDNGSR